MVRIAWRDLAGWATLGTLVTLVGLRGVFWFVALAAGASALAVALFAAAGLFASEPVLESYMDNIPLARTGVPDDIASAVAGATGALKGPLHGGAPSEVVSQLNAIGSPEAAEQLGLLADKALELGIVDEVLGEPGGGAHRDLQGAAENLGVSLRKHLDELSVLRGEALKSQRYDKFRQLGRFTSADG